MARPALPWRSPLVFLPPEGALIWVRRLPWYDKPQRGTASTWGNGVLLTVPVAGTTETSAVSIPWFIVHTWRYQFQADEDAAFPPS